MPDAVVPLSAVGVTYRAGYATLVRDATLACRAGTLTAIVGPNGAGKSTLLRLLSGELVPDAGVVRYGNEPVAAIPPWRLACMRAVLPQASRLAFSFTVAEIVRIGVDGIGRGMTPDRRASIVQEALERADVAGLARRGYASLSGGEQQRTQFARILAQLAAGRSVAPQQVLLLDEPTASLDLQHQISLLEAASALAREGTAVLAILHDLNLAAAFADRIAAVRDGAIVREGRPAEAIDDAMLRAVFSVDLAVGAVPPHGRPFVIPGRAPETRRV